MQSRWHHWELDKVFQVLQSQPSGITYTIARRRLRERRQRKLLGLGLGCLLVVLLVWQPLRSFFFSRLGILATIVMGGHWLLDRFLTRQGRGDKFTPHKAIVKRDDRYILIPSKSLAPGDIICLQPGSEVDADVRLVALKDLVVAREEQNRWQTQIKDTTAPLPWDIPPAEQSNMVYHGSLVVEGEAMGVVVKTYKSPPSAYEKLFAHFPFFYSLLGGWLVLVLLLSSWHWSDKTSIIIYLLVAVSVPWHWWAFCQACLAQVVTHLSEEVQFRAPFLVWTLTKIKTIVVDLNTYDISKRSDRSIKWQGLWHGEKEEIETDIPLYYFTEGLVLPPGAALLSDSLVDKELITKVDIAISSVEADPVLQRRCGIVLAKPDIGLLQKVVRYSRMAIDRLRHILLLNLTSGLAALLLLTASKGGKIPLVTPVQIVWSAILLPVVLSLVLLLVPAVASRACPASHVLDRGWWLKLLITTVTISGLTVLVWRFGSVSLAWTVFNFSLLGLAFSSCQLHREAYEGWRGGRSYLAAVVIVVCVVLQMVWIQTGRSGMLPLGLGGWLVAVLLAAAMFWLSGFLNPSAESNRHPASVTD
ncbi:MAG: hypothetical protein ACK421_06185 [Pseudanabaenaceae cyanobacterium]